MEKSISSVVTILAGILLARFTAFFSEPLRAEGRRVTAFTIDFFPILLGALIILIIWLKNRS